MFVAHAPAGYLITKALTSRRGAADTRRLMALGVFCSVLPDLDLFYFYTLGGRERPHHTYWTHLPLFWGAVAALLGAMCVRKRELRRLAAIAMANVSGHLVLDSVASQIYWAFPLSSEPFGLFAVEARFGWWVLNFVLHWTFGIEIAIVATALAVWWRSTHHEPARHARRLERASRGWEECVEPGSPPRGERVSLRRGGAEQVQGDSG